MSRRRYRGYIIDKARRGNVTVYQLLAPNADDFIKREDGRDAQWTLLKEAERYVDSLLVTPKVGEIWLKHYCGGTSIVRVEKVTGNRAIIVNVGQLDGSGRQTFFDEVLTRYSVPISQLDPLKPKRTKKVEDAMTRIMREVQRRGRRA